MLTLGNKLTLNSQPIYHFVNKYSIDFDGVDDRIITDGADTVAQPTTYSFWCKSSETSFNVGVFGHGEYRQGAFHFNYDADRPLLYLGTDYFVYWNDTSAQDDGEWHHWVVYLDTNNLNNCKLYVDGVLQTVNTVRTTGSLDAYTESLTIGSNQAVGGNCFEGKIDEFAVYDRELTQAEITRMYNTYYSPNRVANGNFSQIGNEEVTNGDFSQIGSELVTNGDFASGSSWVFIGTAEISGGYGVFPDATSSYIIQGAVVPNSVKQYKLQYEVIETNGGTLKLAGGSSAFGTLTLNNSVGVHTFYLTSNGTVGNLQFFNAASFIGKIDNVSVKEVGQGFTFGDGWGMGDGLAECDGTQSTFSYLQQTFSTNLTNDKFYKINYTLTRTSGNIRLSLTGGGGTVESVDNSSSDTYTVYLQANGDNTTIRFRADSSFVGSIDDLSIKEVGQHWTFGTGWSMGDGVANATDAAFNSQLTDSTTLVAGKEYKISFNVSNYVKGNVNVTVGNVSSSTVAANGSYTFNLTTLLTTPFRINTYAGGSGTTLSVDNIVLQELKHDATNLMLNAGAYQSANPLITSTKSMEFDGSDDYLQLSEPFSYTNHTITGWFKKDITSTQLIFDAADNNADGIRIFVDTDSKLNYRVADGSSSTRTSGVLDNNRWYNFSCTYDGTTMKIYIDGVEANSLSTTKTISTTTNVTIGKASYTDNLYYNGKITEVGAYDRALTSLEVASLYNQGMPTNLLVNRNDYQSGNPTVFNTKQVDFDGTDDYMQVSNFNNLGTSDASFSFWVNCSDFTNATFLAKWQDNSNRILFLTNGSDQFLTQGRSSGFDRWSSTLGGALTSYENEWINLIVTIDRSADLTLYLNGVSYATTDISSTSSSSVDNTGDWTFGQYGGGTYFNGEMSQVGMWNKVLTADEVSSLYNHGLPIDLTTNQAAYESSSNLVGYWRMGSGTLDTYPLIADQTNATLGSEQLTNGDFATDSNWSKGTGWSIANGKATHAGGSINTYLNQTSSTTVGKIYKAVFTLSGSLNATNYIQVYGTNSYGGFSNQYTSAGTYTLYFTADATFFRFRAVSPDNDVSIDNVSVKQVNGNPAIMTNQTSSDIENGSPYANIVQNGTFDTDTDWAKQAGWTISGGTANFVEAGGNRNIYQNILTLGKTYKLTYTVLNYVSGAIRNVSANPYIERTANGTYTETFVAVFTNLYLKCAVNSQLSIDNVTVEEVNTGLQGYWKMGDGTNDEYPVIYDQTNPTLGSELVTNGDFASATGWTIEAVWTISDGAAHGNGASGSSQELKQTILEVGSSYKFVYEIKNYVSGSVELINSGLGYSLSNNIYTGYGVATSTELRFRGSSFNGDIDNVSVKKISGNYATMTNMVEGNITNQYPLTKIRNYYRMGDGILDGYPIIQDQTSPNLAHIPTTNLITYSEDFSNAYWTKDRTTVVSGQLSPSGDTSAFKLKEDTTVGSHKISTSTIHVSSGINNTYSIYVKAAERTKVGVREEQHAGKYATFNLLTKAIISNTGLSANIITLSNDWLRIDYSQNSGGGLEKFSFFLLNDGYTSGSPSSYTYTGDGTSGVFIYGAQLEEQSQATAYIKSDGIAAVRKATTTNLLEYSEDFSQSYWHKDSQVNLTPNYAIAPDGTMTGYKATSTYNFRTASNITINAGTVCTFSVYIKNIDATSLIFLARDNTNSNNYYNKNYTAEVNTNDWTRIEITFTTSTGTANLFYINSQGFTPLGDYLVWGAQLEVQTQAETYAKTTGLPVTIDLFTENNYGTMTNMSASDIVEDTP